MIIGIGMDLCEVRRMEPMLEHDRFLQRYFTSEEQAYIFSKNVFAAQSLAGHFAAKEAAFKALRCGIAHPMKEIEISHDAQNAPFFRLSGGALERMFQMGGKALRLSITHINEMAAAVAILEGREIPGIINRGECAPSPFLLEKENLLHDMIGDRFPFSVLSASDANALLPSRPFDAHKATCGHALIVAGSFGMAGAASLCINAALRGGAGLVTAACPPEIIPIVQTLAPCAMCVPVDELESALFAKTAIAAGPGLGVAPSDQAMQTLLEAPLPQVWDADALNWLSRHPAKLPGAFVLTPHYGEAARLLETSSEKIVSDPAGAAFRLHSRYGAVILLKGPVTLITDGKNCTANMTGTPGMATGGSGDVLTGLIASFLAQGLPPFDAARLSAFLHGKAGEAAAEYSGTRSMTAQDILSAVRIE